MSKRCSRLLMAAGLLTLVCAADTLVAHAQNNLQNNATLPPPAGPIPSADKPLLLSVRPARTDALTVDGAVALALISNREIARSNAALLAATGRRQEARSLRNPVLTADAGAVEYSSGVNQVRDQKIVEAARRFQPTYGANFTLPIDIAGYLRAANGEAAFAEVAARLDVNRARNTVVADVKAAFYNVLRARALVAVAQENLQDSVTRFNDANVKFQAQTVAILDVVRAQTDVAEAQQRLIVARNDVTRRTADLNSTIGIDVNTPLEVADTGAVTQPPGIPAPAIPRLPAMEGDVTGKGGNDEAALLEALRKIGPPTATLPANPPTPSLMLGGDFDALVKEALATRPEVLAGDAEVAASRQGIAYARRSSLPALSAGVRYEYAVPVNGPSVAINNGQLFAGLTVPLSDGGLARSRVTQAVARRADAEVARRQATDFVALEVRQSYLDLTEARDRVAVANQAVTQAREAFLIARLRYSSGVTGKAGVSPLLEVSDAQTALTLAETRQVNALYDYNSAGVRLDRAVGRYSYAKGQPGFDAVPPARVVGR